MWIALPCQASSLQGHHSVNRGVLVGSDWGTGSGWQQSRQNFSTTCSDRTLGLNVMQKPLLSWSCTTSPYFLFLLAMPCCNLSKIPLQSKDFQARKPPVLEQQKKEAIKLWVIHLCSFYLCWAESKHTALSSFFGQGWEGTYPPPLPGWGWLCCKVVHLSRIHPLTCVSP